MDLIDYEGYWQAIYGNNGLGTTGVTCELLLLCAFVHVRTELVEIHCKDGYLTARKVRWLHHCNEPVYFSDTLPR